MRTPTQREIDELDVIFITSSADWNPHLLSFQEMEEAYENDSECITRINAINVQSYCNEIIHDVMNQIDKTIARENSSSSSKNRRSPFANKDEIAQIWAVGQATATDRIKATTQNFIRSALHPIEHRFRTKQVMLRYNNLACKIYSDIFFSDSISIAGNKCAQLFVSDFGYIKFVPTKLKSEAGYALQEFLRDNGIPTQVHTDKAKELALGTWKQVCRDVNILMTKTEPKSPWQNRTEVEIRELKKHTRRFMSRTGTPLALWDYCCQYTAEFRNRIV